MKSAFSIQSTSSLRFNRLLFCVPLALIGALAIVAVPDQLVSWPVVLGGIAGLAALAAMAALLLRTLDSSQLEQAIARLMLLVWFVLLVSQHLFVRRGLPEQVLQGSFGGAAYLEVSSWLILLVPLVVVLLAFPQALNHAFSFENRWCLLLAVLALASAAYSPLPSFSFVWALKVCVAALTLQMWFYVARNRGAVAKFWNVTFWAAATLLVLPLLSLLSHPATAFGWRGFSGEMEPEFRLNTNIHPVDLTQIAGLLLILALGMYYTDGRRSRIAWLTLAALVMILGGGKAAIFSGILCCGLLLVLLNKKKKAVLTLLLLTSIAAALLVLTPLRQYISDYEDTETASTLTGRTELWEKALPLIAQAPILGHGFMASKFIGEEADTGWDAGHLHNAYLEILYNNGVIGLSLILLIQLSIFRNLMRALKTSAGPAQVIAASAFATFVYLLLNGIVEPTFGGRPSWSFLLFLALVPFSQRLCQVAPAAEHSVRRPARTMVRGYSPATSH